MLINSRFRDPPSAGVSVHYQCPGGNECEGRGRLIISKVVVCCLNGCFRKPPSTKTPSIHHTLHTDSLSQQVQLNSLASRSLYSLTETWSLDKMNWD